MYRPYAYNHIIDRLYMQEGSCEDENVCYKIMVSNRGKNTVSREEGTYSRI